jgi:D-sedoheptulose 7-phosphate isomerase
VTDAGDIVRRTFEEAIALHRQVLDARRDVIVRAATVVGDALVAGRKVLVFGNGGSATDAQHFASELVGRFGRHVDRVALPVLSLASDVATLSSIANDFGYPLVFARQIQAFGQSGDVAMAFTTSGRSANVNEGLREALGLSLTTVVLTGGDGGESGKLADVHVNVPHASPDRVQEVHRTILHVVCGIVEQHPAVVRLKSA